MGTANDTTGKKPRRKPPDPLPPPPPEEIPAGPVPPTLGGKLMELIEARNLTIARAAAMSGMTRQQLWRILQGDVPNPGILTVQTAVRSLGGRMKDLFEDGDLVPGGLRNHEEGS